MRLVLLWVLASFSVAEADGTTISDGCQLVLKTPVRAFRIRSK